MTHSRYTLDDLIKMRRSLGGTPIKDGIKAAPALRDQLIEQQTKLRELVKELRDKADSLAIDAIGYGDEID